MEQNRNYNEKLSIVSIMMQMALKDGSKSSVEIKFIADVCHLYGLNINDVDHTFMQKSDFSFSNNLYDRIADFQKVLLLMFVDQELHENEVKFCMEIALKMGISPVVVKCIIERVIEKGGAPVDPKELMDLHRMHDN